MPFLPGQDLEQSNCSTPFKVLFFKMLGSLIVWNNGDNPVVIRYNLDMIK